MIDAPRIYTSQKIQFRFTHLRGQGRVSRFFLDVAQRNPSRVLFLSLFLSLSFSLSLSLFLSPSLFTKQRACFNDDSFFVAGAFYAFSLATPIELIDFIGCGILLFDTKRQRACIIYRPCIGCLETNRDNCLSFTIQLSYIQILYILVTYNATRN